MSNKRSLGRSDRLHRKKLGRLLTVLRKKRGISRLAAVVALGRNESGTRVLQRYEKGERCPRREWLLRYAVQGLHQRDPKTINRLLKAAGYETLDATENVLCNLVAGRMGAMPEPQTVRWGPLDDGPPGVHIDGTELFIPWQTLKSEVERKLLNQLGRVIPQGCTAELARFHGRENWRVLIIGADGKHFGRLWFGPDPVNDWRPDGLVRAGKTNGDYEAEVWQIFQRFSDGSYRLVRAIR